MTLNVWKRLQLLLSFSCVHAAVLATALSAVFDDVTRCNYDVVLHAVISCG